MRSLRDGFIKTNKELGLEVGPGGGVKDMKASQVWGGWQDAETW